MNYQLFHGDCLEVMPTLEAGSVDAIVTDPPYGLSFMGKGWDHGVPGVPYWVEALRVAKPGAFLFAFGGTRTHHRLMVAIEDAGWEIRDCMMWVYGSGFPKSANISKLIDDKLGAEREVIEARTGPRPGNHGGSGHYGHGVDRSITAPATQAARLFDGYGTALKPAWEPIIVAMKPVEGTFANNALTHGLAGLNIDECRVAISDGATMARNNKPGDNGWKNSSGGANNAALHGEPSGRWPANLIHDGSDEVMSVFDRAGVRTTGAGGITKQNGGTNTFGSHRTRETIGYDDTGSAARFFYCAKASTSERSAGLDSNGHPTVKPLELCRYLCRLVKTPTGGTILDPFMGSGSTGVAALLEDINFVGIEKEAEYLEIARQRLEHYEDERSTEPLKLSGKPSDTENLPLFA